ncbi:MULTISPECIES: GntR family transcriptional regulator [Pseudonocardia]|uniref:GntR family transcriptional regulator n=2 Tax=Pseudonocardia TaxID=1847 RepID=A0ABQ0S3V9_9PSEU|nr:MULTISPECIES: GntR family transcriptional regulator [Pseudonocardia]OSY42323.1 putative HTH-type transcriptional regulator YdfH [Pseudonocardia autotrophica]TDN75843.1 GntR family transcriptional regulator [Pseudonocardia autotrophica]BBF99814.1 GntR family transcriptional regulator [Pseudonocardia autotrophica]GEC27600.1 GntR family transcriptional regulator [Pseudonocardia saturnea]
MERLADQPSKADQLTVAVRDAIRSGELTPDRLYSAQELGELFGVSRTPVREALLKLANAGLVRIERNRGARVLHSTEADITEVSTLRLLLEPAATGRAAANPDFPFDELTATLDRMRAHADEPDGFFRADCDFHDVIMRAGGNQRLAGIVLSLRDAIALQGRRSMPNVRGATQIIAEHRAVADAVASGDRNRASAAMREHLLSTADVLSEDSAAWRQEWQRWV